VGGSPANSLDSEWPLALARPDPHLPPIALGRTWTGAAAWAWWTFPCWGYGAKEPGYDSSLRRSPGSNLPSHSGAGTLSATDTGQGEWPSHLIDDSLTVVHGVHIMDWDNDGRDEILTASFEGVHLFHSTGAARDLRWTKIHLAAGDQVSTPRRGSSEIGVGRLEGRRFLATIEPWHGEHVVVYTQAKPGDLWSRHPIDDTFSDGHALACADLDGDGNDEIVAGFRGQE
jgi:hypothetical protein